jgi:hypothetical protein
VNGSANATSVISRNAACAHSASAISADVPSRSRANISRAGPIGAAVRGVRAVTYASYFARWAGDALSVGITTSPCDTRAFAPAGCAARNARMWDNWTSAKSVDSSAFTTEEVSRFTPFSPAQLADASEPPPYHIRERSPGECGSTREENCSNPSVPAKSAAGSPATNRSSRDTRS